MTTKSLRQKSQRNSTAKAIVRSDEEFEMVVDEPAVKKSPVKKISDEDQMINEVMESVDDSQIVINDFDPEQNYAERREIRIQYRSLLNNSTDEQQLDVKNILNSVKAANQIYSQVKNPNEAALDSRLLVASAELGTKRSKMMRQLNSQFDVQAFLGHLVQFVTSSNDADEGAYGEEINFKKLGKLAFQQMITAPRASFLFGPLAITKKVRVQKARVKRDKGELKTAVTIESAPTETNAEKSNQATRHIKEIYDLIRSVEKVNFWQLIINPTSFSQTVENNFYCAFLAKDDKISVFLEDGIPFVCAKQEKTEEEISNLDIEKRKQYFVSIDFAVWQKKIQELSLTESFIPLREPESQHKEVAGGKSGTWY